MADKQITELTAGSSLSDADVFLTRQGSDTEDKKVTGSQIKAYAQNGVFLTASDTTDDITEGAGNFYYTDERVDDRVNGLLTAGTNITLTYDDGAGSLTIDAAAGASGITVNDEAVEIATGVTTLNFAGSGVTAADAGSGVVNVTVAGGTAPVDSVFGRTGAVTASNGDYDAVQIDYDNATSGLSATNVKVALDELTSEKAETSHTHTLSDVTDSGALAAKNTIVNADIDGAAAIALSKLASDPLARANHTGTQLMSTISNAGDLATQDKSDITANETDVHTGTETGKFVTPADLKPREALILAASDESTALTVGAGKMTFRMPYAFQLSAVRASVTTAPSGSTLIVDINESGSTILSTKLSIDAGEKTSTTAASSAVISDSVLADDSEITIDIDQIGSSTAGAGLKVVLIGNRT